MDIEFLCNLFIFYFLGDILSVIKHKKIFFQKKKNTSENLFIYSFFVLSKIQGTSTRNIGDNHPMDLLGYNFSLVGVVFGIFRVNGSSKHSLVGCNMQTNKKAMVVFRPPPMAKLVFFWKT